MTEPRRITLAELLPVMGDLSPVAKIYVATPPDAGRPIATDSRTALSVHGCSTVLRCLPKGSDTGMPDANMYVLDEGRPTEGYVVNPNPLPVDVPCWRVRDEAWFVPNATGDPVAGTITGISYPTRHQEKALMTVQTEGFFSMQTYTGIPVDALFATKQEAIDAAAGRILAKRQEA